MSYQALYRVWRPQSFREVVGQSHITQTLQNALTGEHYSHAYLFTGPRGTGKTSTAKILAKAINCVNAPVAEPCNECPACIGISMGTVVDVVEIDAASNNGVDEIRDIRDKVRFAPTEVPKKVYIIDEVHMLSQGAFNALLKTLEEPPAHVIFVLATTEPHKIPLTIISRCQRFDFKRIAKNFLVEHLQHVCQGENVQIQEAALHLLAQVAEGGMRDALSLLDQVSSFSNDHITVDDVLAVTGAVSQDTLSLLAEAILTNKIEQVIASISDLMDQGKEPVRLVEDLIYYFRDMLVYQSAPDLEGILEKVYVTEQFMELTKSSSQDVLFKIIERLSRAQHEMKWSNYPRVFLEVACIQLVQGIQQRNNDDGLYQEQAVYQNGPSGMDASLLERIESLEKTLKQLQAQKAKVVTSNAQQQQKFPTASAGIASTSFSQAKVKKILATASKPMLEKLKDGWGSILEVIKKEKISLKALLNDSRPTACTEEIFILAFKNDFHRNKTEEEGNRLIIEEVVSTYLQSPVKMVTMLESEWDETKEQFKQEHRGVVTPTQPASPTTKQDEWIEEAVKLVGKDLVEVIDEP